eukprot:gene14828-16368_t
MEFEEGMQDTEQTESNNGAARLPPTVRDQAFAEFAENRIVAKEFTRVALKAMNTAAPVEEQEGRVRRIDELLLRTIMQGDVIDYHVDDKQKLICQLVLGNDFLKCNKWQLASRQIWLPQTITFAPPNKFPRPSVEILDELLTVAQEYFRRVVVEEVRAREDGGLVDGVEGDYVEEGDGDDNDDNVHSDNVEDCENFENEIEEGGVVEVNSDRISDENVVVQDNMQDVNDDGELGVLDGGTEGIGNNFKGALDESSCKLGENDTTINRFLDGIGYESFTWTPDECLEFFNDPSKIPNFLLTDIISNVPCLITLITTDNVTRAFQAIEDEDNRLRHVVRGEPTEETHELENGHCALGDLCSFRFGTKTKHNLIKCKYCLRQYHIYCASIDSAKETPTDWSCFCHMRVDPITSLPAFASKHTLRTLLQTMDKAIMKYLADIVAGRIYSPRVKLFEDKAFVKLRDMAENSWFLKEDAEEELSNYVLRRSGRIRKYAKIDLTLRITLNLNVVVTELPLLRIIKEMDKFHNVQPEAGHAGKKDGCESSQFDSVGNPRLCCSLEKPAFDVALRVENRCSQFLDNRLDGSPFRTAKIMGAIVSRSRRRLGSFRMIRFNHLPDRSLAYQGCQKEESKTPQAN